MRAINLIPADERRARTSGGRSGGVVYVLLGALTLIAALAVMYGLTAKTARDKQAELADVTARATAAERTAQALAPYTTFTDVRRQRTQAVTTIAKARVDWAHVLHELARTMPSGAWLTSVHARTGAATATPSSGTTAPADAAGAPSVDLTGCTTAQSAVPALIADLRRMDGVTGARLTTAANGNAATGTAGASASAAGASGAGASGSGSPCAKAGRVTFNLTLSFSATASPAAAPATATTTAGSTQ